MDRREFGTAISAMFPTLAAVALERAVGQPMSDFLAWPLAAPVLLLAGLGIAAIWIRLSRRWVGASAMELQAALDKVIDHIYVLPPAAKPAKGITTQGIVQEHAPHNFRRDWYVKLGLPEPKPHQSQYR